MAELTTTAMNYIIDFNATNNNESKTSDDTAAMTVCLIFGMYLTFIFATVGIVGNILSMVVLTKVMLRGTRLPLFLILIALAASDSLLLLFNIILNVMSVGYNYVRLPFMLPMYLLHGKIIPMFWPLALAFQMISIYLTVLVSYERWLAVCRPFHASSQCSLKRIALIITFICLISIGYNVPHWWEYESIRSKISVDQATIIPATGVCTPDQTRLINSRMTAYSALISGNATTIISRSIGGVTTTPAYNWDFYTDLLNKVCNATIVNYDKSEFSKNTIYRYVYNAGMYAAMMFLLPFLAITALNVALVRTLQRSRKKWVNMSRSQRKEVKLSTVPLAIVGLFYIFGMPAVMINLIDSINAETQYIQMNDANWQAYLAISNFCVVVNSSINFVIYSMLGEKFRHTLMSMCGCLPASHRLQRHLRPPASATDVPACSTTQHKLGCSPQASDALDMEECGIPLIHSLPLGGTERAV